MIKLFLEQRRRSVLREKDSTNKNYLYGLFWSNELGETNKDEFISCAQKHQIS